MVIESRITNDAYERLALAEPDRKWELRDGVLREKPGMTYSHNAIGFRLGVLLYLQLDWSAYEVRINAGRVHRPGATYFIPDVFVFTKEMARHLVGRDDLLEVYHHPLPLVVEVWSPSTGDDDVEEKLTVYKQRGDLEIWYIHPYKRTLTAWRRNPDGSYDELAFGEGTIEPISLPNVSIDLTALYNG
jgi:Uma2 family endonuclease